MAGGQEEREERGRHRAEPPRPVDKVERRRPKERGDEPAAAPSPGSSQAPPTHRKSRPLPPSRGGLRLSSAIGPAWTEGRDLSLEARRIGLSGLC